MTAAASVTLTPAEAFALFVEDLEFLLANRVHPELACRRLGTNVTAAARSCHRHGRHDLARTLDQASR